MGSKVKNYILVKKKKQKLSIVKFSMNCVSMTDIVQMTRTITIKWFYNSSSLKRSEYYTLESINTNL